LLIPADRIVNPFFLRESERCFNVRTHVDFSNSFIQIRLENDRGNLFHQRPIAEFRIGFVRELSNRAMIGVLAGTCHRLHGKEHARELL
jgi:hypothetical protein